MAILRLVFIVVASKLNVKIHQHENLNQQVYRVPLIQFQRWAIPTPESESEPEPAPNFTTLEPESESESTFFPILESESESDTRYHEV